MHTGGLARLPIPRTARWWAWCPMLSGNAGGRYFAVTRPCIQRALTTKTMAFTSCTYADVLHSAQRFRAFLDIQRQVRELSCPSSS